MNNTILHILNHINKLQALDLPHLISIDGRCASGKTTLADALAETLACPVVHMDDFFLPPEMRTAERLSLPGENAHHERVLSEVILPLSRGETAVYRPYDCHTNTLLDEVRVPPARMILVEGSYACHPSLLPFYSLRIFLSADRETQLARIKARNGEEMFDRFCEQFIPMEEMYFSALHIPEKCQITLDTKEITL